MFTIINFTPHVRTHPQGSKTLGFVDVRLNHGGHSIDLHDLTVKLTVEGKPSVSMPRRAYTNSEGEERSRATARLDLETYQELVKAVHGSNVVKAARKAA